MKYNITSTLNGVWINSRMRSPIHVWGDYPDDKTLEQLENLANLPFIWKHVAAMPDKHMGYGMPIGGVACTEGVVIPNAVGVDIGCGMLSCKTSLTSISTEQLKQIMHTIRYTIPVGFKHHSEPQDATLMPELFMTIVSESPELLQEWASARNQLGTLGGGNHFIEIQRGDDGFIYIMIHSGSRNVGKKVADHHNKIAKKYNKLWHTEADKVDLAFLPLEIMEDEAASLGEKYLADMNWCAKFAVANRALMMERVKQAFLSDVSFEESIDVAHNYARLENHYGKNVVVHRKGATSAREGETGIIPGSQGSCSYIVRGLGNRESFNSCSHGAGRKMGRNQARKNLNLEDEIKQLDDKGIIHSIRTEKDLDEATGAYKDIDEVMEQQKDLVEIVTKLEPLAVIKG